VELSVALLIDIIQLLFLGLQGVLLSKMAEAGGIF
jgi:hypothetical protein